VLVVGSGIGVIAVLRSGAARDKAEVERQERAAAAESAAIVARADSMRLAMMDTSASVGASPSTDAPAATGAGTAPTTKPDAAPTASAAATSKPAATGSKAAPQPAGTSKPSSAPPAGSRTSTGAAAPTVAARGPFGIDVGTFLFEDRANSEQTRLAGTTGLSGKVAAKAEGDATVYHVILGSFATRAEAEKEAGALIAKGLVREASPVPLSR